jgi:iron(III) transport system substrate-binding protein
MIAVKPKVYPKNSPQVKAVSNGEIDVGWVNHYYLHKLRAANRNLKAANYSFTAPGDAGNLLMLSGVAITAHAKRTDAAEKLVNFLVSDEAQTYFAQKVYEYPTVAGIKTHPDVPAKADGWAAVDQAALADVAGTVALLRALKLQ